MSETRARALRFFCCHRDGDEKCILPAPDFYRLVGEDPQPLCARHALQSIGVGVPVCEWARLEELRRLTRITLNKCNE